jgi:putative transposase
MENYSTNITDNQWQSIEKLINNKRKRKFSLRIIINSLFYISKTGVQWRLLPKDFPKWQLVYYYFRKWTGEGLIEEIHDTLRGVIRKNMGKEESPSLGLLDSQSVKTQSMTTEKAYDGNKKINGRKRHIITDTLGLIMVIVIHCANIQDRAGARKVIEELRYKYPRLKKILADQGYTGDLINWVMQFFGWTVEIVKKVAGISGFNVLPKRWIVERTFGWLSFQRRLVRDYEQKIECSQSFVYIAMIRIMLNRFKK